MKKLDSIFIIVCLCFCCLSTSAISAQQSWFQSGQDAAIILGPFGDKANAKVLNHPSRVCLDPAGRLFVSDTRNNRVLIWNSIPTSHFQPADVVLGQPDVYSTDSSGGSSGMNWPQGVFSDGTRLFVADTDNNRVLIWNSIPATNGQPADLVLGQPDFTPVVAATSYSRNTLDWPWDVYYDGMHLFVVDTHVGRVLIWNSLPTQNGQNADVVVGQPDFGDRYWTQPTQASLYTPRSVVSDGTHLVVSEYSFHRIMIWNSIPTTNGQPADVVLFHDDFVTDAGGYTAMGICLSNGKLYAGMGAEHCIFAWNNIPTQNTTEPEFRIGHGPSLASDGMSAPWGASSDGTHFCVADTNNSRVLIYNSIPTGEHSPADVVLGQDGFDKNCFLAPNGIRSVSGVSSSGHHLFLSTQIDNRIVIHEGLPEQDCADADYIISSVDFNTPVRYPFPFDLSYHTTGLWTDGVRLIAVSSDRGIMIWDSIPKQSLVEPDHVIGGKEGCTAAKLGCANGVTSDGTHLFVSDSDNNRVLIWNTIPEKDGAPADLVLGQSDFTSKAEGYLNTPSGLATDGTHLAVADWGHFRILIWNTLPTQNNQQPDVILTTGAVPPEENLYLTGPADVCIFDNHLFVGDHGRARVLVWNTIPTADATRPDVVLGQPSFLSKWPHQSRSGLKGANRLCFDGDYLWVGEFKFSDRVLGFRANIPQSTPEAPSSLAASQISAHQIDLTWVDNASSEQGFKLERKTGSSGTYEQICYLSAMIKKYSDTKLSPGTQYYYRIKAYNRYGDSAYSNEAEATTTATNNPPHTPSNPSPANGQTSLNANIQLSWDGGDPDAGDTVTYDVYLDTVNPPTYCAAKELTKTYYPTFTLSFNKVYYWKVVAKDLSQATSEGPVWSFQTVDIAGYTLNLSAGSGGTTYPRPGTYTYTAQDFISLTAIPDADYAFSKWTGDISSGDENKNPLPLTMSGNKNITANFTSTSGGGDDGGSTGKKGCFIATAAYGSPLHSSVRILRDFRDRRLMPYKLGRTLVKVYYRFSPPVAHFVAKHSAMKVLVRIMLLPLIGLSLMMLKAHPAIPAAIIGFLSASAFFICRLRKKK